MVKVHFSYRGIIKTMNCNYDEKLSTFLPKLNFEDMDINSVYLIYENKKIKNKDLTLESLINNINDDIKEIYIQIFDKENYSINNILNNSLNNSQNIKKTLDIFNNDIEDIIYKLHQVKDNINILYNSNLNFKINNNNEIDKNEIYREINEIINDNNIKNKFKKIMNIYNKIIPNDEITLIYSIDKSKEKIKIFNEKFVNNNKKICKIYYEDDELPLQEYFNIKNIKKGILELKLKTEQYITDMDSMFSGCESLISLPDISKLNTNFVTNMSNIFYNCSSLYSISDISKWYTNNVTNMSCLFYRCSNLISIPDISTWKTNKVDNISGMFYRCSSLISLPNISKWNTENITDINRLFYGCSSLITLPDISKWDIKKVNNMEYIFSGCLS